MRRSADSIQQFLLKGDDNPDVVQQELLLHSSMRTSLWLEQADGVLVLPQSDHLAISDSAIRASMALNPERLVGLQKLVNLDGQRYLSELVQQFPSGSRLWINHEVSANQQALSNYLALMIVIWSSCLGGHTPGGELAGGTDRATAGATQCRHRSGDRRNPGISPAEP